MDTQDRQIQTQTNQILEKDRINEIVDAIMKVARGDYSVQVELSAKKDELDSLAMGVNMMIDDIRTSTEDLERQSKELRALNKRLQQDITERKQAEEMFKTLAMGSTVGIFIVQDRKLVFVNPQFQKDVGLTEEELLGTDPLSLVHPEDRELVRKNAVEMLKGDRLAPYEFRTLRKDGETGWAMETVASVQYQGRRAALGNFMVVTERKQMEQELRERVKELNCLYGIAKIAEKPLITLDELYREVVNLLPASWQYPENTCARITIDGKEFKTENYRDAEWKQSSDIKVRGEKVGVVEVSYMEERPASDEGPFLKEERQLIGAVAERLGRITERKWAEEALLVRDRAIASSLSGIAITNMQANITYVNHSFLQMWGYDDDKEVLGTSGIEFWQLKEKAAEALHTIQEKGNWFGELTAIRKDGTSLDVQISASTITGVAGEPIGIVASFVDITERVRAQRELQEKNEQLDAQNEELQSQSEELMAQQQKLQEITRELEAATQAKSEFFSSISHELRSPLHLIKGFTKLILGGKVPDPETQKEFLAIVDKQSEHLHRLIDNLLDISRLESGRLSIEKQRLLVKDLLHDTIQGFYSLANERSIILHEDIPAILPEMEVDKQRLEQVMVNLLSNATKFSNDGGSITVKAEVKDNKLLVHVADHGIGIPEEAMPHLFERFYQAKDSGRVGGAGLGLYISKQIIEAHGGHIWVESKVGEGSTFSFALPLD